MSRLAPRSSWMTFLVMVLLAVSTNHAHPLPGITPRKTELQPRSPRLIPDTANYLADVFGTLGILGFGKDAPSLHYEKGKPQNEHASTTQGRPTPTPRPSPSPTSSSDSVAYTETFQYDGNDHKPIENIQIMSGYSDKKDPTVQDVPVVLDALYKTLADRVRNMVDESDELTLR